VGTSAEGPSCGLQGMLSSENLVYYIILVLTPLLIPFTWIRHIKYFAITNFVANILIIFSVLFMVVSFASELISEHQSFDKVALARPSGALVYFGTAMYAFEATSMMLPIERSMAEPDRIGSVVCWTMLAIVCTQMGFFSSAYLLYTDKTASIITLSMSHGSPLGGVLAVQFVQVAWVVEVIFTFPLQIFPAATLIESRWLAPSHSGRKWLKNFIRASLLLFCMLVALGGYSSVNNLVALIGAVGCAPLAVVFPPLFHLRVLQQARSEGCKDASDVEDSPATESSQLPHGQRRSLIAIPEELYDCQGELSGRIEWSCWAVAVDLFILCMGAGGMTLAVILAVKNWLDSDFSFQQCIQLNATVVNGVR